jgi:hypothetical protein
MRLRRLELRLIALTLTVLWTLTAALVLLGYRPGGPLDAVVGLAVVPFAAIALAGFAWPPLARPGSPFVLAVSLGVGAALLLAPSIGGVLRQLEAGGPQTLLPSLEAAYPWALALLATAVFAGIGVVRRLIGAEAPRGRRLAGGVLLGGAATLVAGVTFGAVAVANEIAVGDRPVPVSRYGPTDPDADPQPCDAPLTIPSSAVLAGSLDGTIDRASIGQAGLEGRRVDTDFRWQGIVASDVALGRFGAARIGDEAWTAEPRQPWEPASPAALTGQNIDRRFVRIALSPDRTAVNQDLGLAVIGGARARHCRVATDGAVVSAALPITSWIVGDADIARWRGEIDYFVFLDGSIGVARGSVNGEAFVLGRPGLLGTFGFELEFLDRGRLVVVEPPA